MLKDDGSQNSGMDNASDTCAVCGRHLAPGIRSKLHPDTCKGCAGEQDDPNDDLDDFK